MSIDVIKLAEQADDYADAKIAQPGEYHPDWNKVRDERFAALVLEEAEKNVARQIGLSPQSYHTATVCIAAIRALKPQE